MAIYQLDDQTPELAETAWVADNAQVMGAVKIAADASVWFGVTVRGDTETIEIGEGSNIQDGTVIHADPGFPMVVGENVPVGHSAMLHGCTIGDGSLVGINAVVLNGARVGKGCLIGANALVTEGMEIPDGSLVLGSPAKIKAHLDDEQQLAIRHNADHYVGNAKRFSESLQEQE